MIDIVFVVALHAGVYYQTSCHGDVYVVIAAMFV